MQDNRIEWIPSYYIKGLAFVAFEDEMGGFDDCRGMSHFYLTKCRMTSVTREVSIIPRHDCPPFARQIEGFRRIWALDFCQSVFNTIRHIRQEIQRILCRIAQSQGDFASRNAKVHLPSCSWRFIKECMAAGGVQSIHSVKFSRPIVSLSWGLAYHSRRHTGNLDVLRFDTDAKLNVFRSVFGTVAGYGVRKNVRDTVTTRSC